MGGQKPHLRVRSRNNLGAETRLRYAPSTRFYLADRLAGTPWITHLPHLVQGGAFTATREELEQAGAALREAAARVIALAAEGVAARPTPEELEHAKAYAATAAMMRRRAAKPRARGDEDHAAYELERADVFDARAAAKRAGLPMPRELRTPAESSRESTSFGAGSLLRPTRSRISSLTNGRGSARP